MRAHLNSVLVMNIVYFDLETQRTANDVGGWDRKTDMGMSLAVTYSSNLNEYRIYSEKRVDDLIHQLLRADLVVGFNVVNFDYQVLMGYTILDLPNQLRTLDLLVEIERLWVPGQGWKILRRRPWASGNRAMASMRSNGGEKRGSWI